MGHHKRKGPKSTRAGCLLCKPWKRQGGRPRTSMSHIDGTATCFHGGRRRRLKGGRLGDMRADITAREALCGES